MTRGQNRKVEGGPHPRCPECKVDLYHADREVEDVVARLRGEDHLGFSATSYEENWIGYCETFNCFHAGRGDGSITLFLVTSERIDGSWENCDTDLIHFDADPIGRIRKDASIVVGGREAVLRMPR